MSPVAPPGAYRPTPTLVRVCAGRTTGPRPIRPRDINHSARSRCTLSVADSVVGETAPPSRCSEGMRVQAHRSQTLVVHAELDPALLAFVKCHITSFVKWDVLRSLSDQIGFWTEPTILARELNRPVDKVRAALDELSYEDIVETSGSDSEPVFRLRDGEPTTVVINRLMTRATRSQELRRIVVAHILQGAVA